MNCNYSIEIDDNGDFPVAFSSHDRVARKHHKCCECSRVIIPGETYRDESGIWDKPKSFKTCRDCLSIRNAFFCGNWIYREVMDNLYDHLREFDGEVSSDCIVELTPKAKDVVFGIIDEIWEL